ncbi:MAG: class II aldolase [Phenylobacterium sp.]|uniref:class II aldolase/adducin family protein n=1 Tax=Phenylobacterium sp. TaxID=1871053 RepID=UPI0025EB7A9D|nr:class II aldolase/adducin family protein [Phenylobacterium sp.]MBI1196308.1 class II aldolase [Phenylobacterium sp.]
MADGSVAGVVSLKDKVSPEEWQARVDLAALYRLVALYDWDDLIYTHISARIPGPEHHFLINPYGLLFDEITASSLVKIDLEGNVLQETPYFINPAGFTIHSAIHDAREDAKFVMHLHSDQGVAVAAQKEGLLPLSQHALVVLPHLAYHDYEGIALNLDERARLVADIGDKSLMLLRNHGTLSVGETAAECWVGMFFLERACKQQVMALSAGRDGVLMAPSASIREVKNQTGRGIGGGLAWPGCLRKLDRELPGYDA